VDPRWRKRHQKRNATRPEAFRQKAKRRRGALNSANYVLHLLKGNKKEKEKQIDYFRGL
jgi:hypothetical protein